MPNLSDEHIANRLSSIAGVYTPVHGVRNEIVRVNAQSVTVKSEQTGREREISFADIRNADNVTSNGVIARVLLAIVRNDISDE